MHPIRPEVWLRWVYNPLVDKFLLHLRICMRVLSNTSGENTIFKNLKHRFQIHEMRRADKMISHKTDNYDLPHRLSNCIFGKLRLSGYNTTTGAAQEEKAPKSSRNILYLGACARSGTY